MQLGSYRLAHSWVLPDASFPHQVTLRDYDFLYLFLVASNGHKADDGGFGGGGDAGGGGGSNRRLNSLRHRPGSAPHVDAESVNENHLPYVTLRREE